MMKKTIEDFLNDEVKEFSISVVKERAFPSVIDGLKPVQRKILYTASKVAKDYKSTKSFVGAVLDVGGYDKGDVSVEQTTNKMVRSFPGSNNVPFLEGLGSFGSRFVPDGAADARYTKVKISDNFYKYFCDQELHTYTEQDNKFFEPDYFLPILPVLLINGTSGIAVGYSCNFQPYSETDIIENIKRYLRNEPMEELVPYYNGFKGNIRREGKDIIIEGCVEQRNKTTFLITEIPIGISREKYIETLNNLVDKNLIKDYTDLCDKNGFRFEIKTTKERGEDLESLDHQKFLKFFGLKKAFSERNLNAITEHGALKEFDNINEIIEYFVQWRLSVMEERKRHYIKKYQKRNEYLKEKEYLLQLILDSKRKFDFHQMKNKAALIESLKSEHDLNHAERLAKTPMYQFNEDELNKTKKERRENDKKIKYYKNVKPTDLYMDDLEKLSGE